jgi:hypothetical protein
MSKTAANGRYSPMDEASPDGPGVARVIAIERFGQLHGFREAATWPSRFAEDRGGVAPVSLGR